MDESSMEDSSMDDYAEDPDGAMAELTTSVEALRASMCAMGQQAIASCSEESRRNLGGGLYIGSRRRTFEIADAIERYHGLMEKGVITEAEFEDSKFRLLQEL